MAPLLREQLERRFAEERLGKELDSVRGNFDRARPALKLRVQRAETLRPGTISAPSPGTSMRRWSSISPASSRGARGRSRGMGAPGSGADRARHRQRQDQGADRGGPDGDLLGSPVRVSGPSVFVATLGLVVEDLLGSATPYGALVAMPSGHIVLCHAIADARSLRVLPAMAAGALQAGKEARAAQPRSVLEAGRSVRRSSGRARGRRGECELHREFDEQVAQRLS